MTEHDLHLIEVGEKVGAEKERAAIVAYVRSKDSYDFDDLANDFEAGEHLK